MLVDIRATAISGLMAGTAITETAPLRIGVMSDMSGPYAANVGPGLVLAVKMAVQDAGGTAVTIFRGGGTRSRTRPCMMLPRYDAALRQRGSLTVWFTDEAIAAWKAQPRTTRAGQPWYSPLASLTALTSRSVFRLALRQTEGLIGSIIRLLGLILAVPNHTPLSRRANTLEVPRPRPRNDGEPMHLLVDSTGLKLRSAGGAGQGSGRAASGIPAEGSGY